MKKLILSCLLGLFVLNLVAQKNYEINLRPKLLNIEDPAFYVEKVIDSRNDKSNIGIVKKGFFNTRKPANLAQGFEPALLNYYQAAVPRGSYQRPIIIKINQLQIEEKIDLTTEYAVVSFKAGYYQKDRLLFTDQQENKVNGLDVTDMHAANIRSVLAESLKTFAASNWLEKLEDQPSSVKLESNLEDSTKTNTLQPNKPEAEQGLPEVDEPSGEVTRNIMALGYQIGGYTLAGINYEIRVHDYLGVHFGAGLAGLTGGFKIHTNPSRDSNFFNLSFKDGGFGAIQTAGVEFGGRWVFKDGARFGLHYQIGLAGIIAITDQMEDAMYGDSGAPDASLVMGVGFSW